ncbi:hypothetical protein AAEX63_10980 [Luteococcus sp. H138]|uniref:hypothetical protein n=1 Tax=unclassified Luteococcus TaxID=2639923 RepID=UPI00313AE8F1
MSENNRFAPDADQDPGQLGQMMGGAENLDLQPTGDDVAPSPVESVGEPRQDDSQADRVRESGLPDDGPYGRDSDGNHLGNEDGAVQTGLDQQQY